MVGRTSSRRYSGRIVSDTAVPETLFARLYEVNWLLVTLISVLGSIGVVMIFAATDGNWNAGAANHLARLIVAGFLMLVIAVVNIRIWYFFAYPIYVIALLLLGAVDVFGVEVNGSTRWLDLKVMRLQPSEIMKLAIVLALARYYHDLPAWRVSRISGLTGGLAIIAIPMLFILRQPDLGTTILLGVTGLTIIFLSGINWRVMLGGMLASAIVIPLFYTFGLQDYQRARIDTLWSPEADPLGAGYHITQSKIALGSGGINGKGFLKGTQRSGDYVPENTTDFIFTVIGEEFGLIGGLATILLYGTVIALCLFLSTKVKHLFSRLLILGVTTTFMLYVFINLAMVTGLIPVVGVPLPLISYGGTVILAVMSGFGLILSALLFKRGDLPRSSS